MQKCLILVLVGALSGCGKKSLTPGDKSPGDKTPLHTSLCAALDQNDLSAAKQLIREGADINMRCRTQDKAFTNQSLEQKKPLEFALENNNEAMILLLLDSPTVKTSWLENGNEVQASSLALKHGASEKVLSALKPVQEPIPDNLPETSPPLPEDLEPEPEDIKPPTPDIKPQDSEPKPQPTEGLEIDKNLSSKLQSLHRALLAKPESGYGSLKKFETWAKLGQWEQFGPQNHYDWWMFPIKAFASATSTTKHWAVTDAEVVQLKESALFMKHYREAVRLMALSWAYDIDTGVFIDNPASGQKWNNYVIRMDKLGQSLKLFGEMQRFNNLVKFRNHFNMTKRDTHWGI